MLTVITNFHKDFWEDTKSKNINFYSTLGHTKDEDNIMSQDIHQAYVLEDQVVFLPDEYLSQNRSINTSIMWAAEYILNEKA